MLKRFVIVSYLIVIITHIPIKKRHFSFCYRGCILFKKNCKGISIRKRLLEIAPVSVIFNIHRQPLSYTI
jgi:hypothetical protein